jgi:tetratricopeptide (TPR) repeat protein
MSDSSVNVFLSLSGTDDAFAERVWKRLPVGLAFFYRRSFVNGEELLSEMERGIQQASIFVFLASQASIKSCWVGFELDQARLQRIQHRHFKVLVFPIESGVSPTMLPQWMRQYWVSSAGLSPKDIARFVRVTLVALPAVRAHLSRSVIGRGSLLDSVQQLHLSAVVETGAAPNVFVFAGFRGIGRRTFARYFIEQALTSTPNLKFGPEFVLPQFSEFVDFYRVLHEEIAAEYSLSEAISDAATFGAMSVADQAEEVISSIAYFGDRDQAVFIVAGNGLVEDRGDPKAWLSPLFVQMKSNPQSKLCLISNRQLPSDFIRKHPNVLQVVVPPLKDADVRALMTATAVGYGVPPVAVSDGIVRSIGGHPDVARAAVRLVVQTGPHTLERNPNELFGIQDEILSENLSLAQLSVFQRDILCVLSWVPQLSGRMLESALGGEAVAVEFAREIRNLILGCLVVVVGSSFAISSAIRSMFRRLHGHGSDHLLERFSGELSREWNASVARNEFHAELFDAFTFMHALEGKTLPPEFRNLLLPSKLQEVVRETYSRGREDAPALERVIEWGSAARQMRMDESTREEILLTVGKAYIRLKRYAEAENVIQFFEESGYRSASFLRGYSLRRQERYSEALPFLEQARQSKKMDRSALQETATCYQRLGKWRELRELIDHNKNLVNDSVSMLDFYIGVLISYKRFQEAESAIRRLRAFPDEDGRSTIREARLMMQRDRKFAQAKELLSSLVAKGVGNLSEVRRWRAMAAAYSGDFVLSRQDIEFLRSRQGRERTAQLLDVHLALASKDHELAQQLFDKIQMKFTQDEHLRMRILDVRASDPRINLAERNRLKAEIGSLRAHFDNTGDIELD